VQGAPHLAISAPTRTGKTRRLLAPAAVPHPGQLVAVSSKKDLAELVLMRRWLCLHPMLTDPMQRVLTFNSRMRDSVAITAIMATVQASSHFDVVYGPKYADALRDIFPGTVVMYGAHERHLLEQASHWEGWPHDAPSPTNQTVEAVRSHHNSGQESIGKSCFPRALKRLSCSFAVPRDAVSKSPTGVSSSPSTTRRSKPASRRCEETRYLSTARPETPGYIDKISAFRRGLSIFIASVLMSFSPLRQLSC